MMLKQKIVLGVHMPCDKCKIEAMTIVARTHGMISLARDADNSKLVIVGEDMDLAFLVTALRKKVGHTTIISVEEVISEAKKKEEKDKRKKEDQEPEWFWNVPPNFVYFNNYDFGYGAASSRPCTWF